MIPRRTFISRMAKSLIAAPFLIGRRSKAGVFLFLVITFTIIMGFIFWKLWGLCKKKLGTTPPPDHGGENNGNAVIKRPLTPQSDGQQTFNIFDNPKAADWFWLIDTDKDIHPDPAGLPYKCYVKLQMEISVDCIEFIPCGTQTFYANENNMLIQDHDENGALASSVVINNWKNKEIKSLGRQLPGGDKAFVRCTSLIKE